MTKRYSSTLCVFSNCKHFNIAFQTECLEFHARTRIWSCKSCKNKQDYETAASSLILCPRFEINTYCTLFQRVNVSISAIFFPIYESSNIFISILGYSKICR